MILRFCIVATYILQAAKSDIMESTGFHCKNANSMRLDRKLHGSPHLTIPPFEFTVLDEDGNYVEYYEPGVNYRIRLVGYIHFRGFMIQSRLSTPEGYLIGSLRGGRFILGDYGEIFGIQYHDCVGLANDSLTHTDNKKKFLIEALWTTDRDVGAVQFLLTVAAEDVLYWERWRPRNGFIRPRSQRGIEVNELLFKIEVAPGPEEPTLSPEEAASTMDPSELTTLEPFDSKLFEAIEEAEENESNRLKSAESLIALHSAITPITFGETATTDTATTVRLTSEEDPTALPLNITEDDIFESSFNNASDMTSFLKMVTSPPTSDEANITEVTRRVFKKFSPSTDDHLRDDDLKFLNSHTHLLQHDFVEPILEAEETCRQANPCENGGICTVKDKKVKCVCVNGFTGDNCTESDRCINNACANNSTCKNGPRGTYICECLKDTVGTYCQFVCAPDQCSGNGECILRHDGKVGCKCISGMTGPRCDREVDECRTAKCKNSLKCIDKFNDYECVCMDGWMGKDCDRPCQDIYGSCKIWRREGQCEIPSEETNFFHLNCPTSCEKCVPRNDTMTPFDRLPAILLPLSWLLGEWHAQIKGFHHRALDYPLDFNATGYNETVIFSVARPVMFGTPSINFTSRAVSDDDPDDVHEHNGFLTIRQYPPVDDLTIKVALSSVNNQGMIFIEEGPLTYAEDTSGPILNIAPIYTKIYDGPRKFAFKRGSRSFVRKGESLVQSAVKELNGQKLKFRKIYKRVRKFDFL